MKLSDFMDENKKNLITTGQYLKDLLQLIPVFIFLSCLLLWLYLRDIHRLDLFIPSLSNISNAMPILFSLILFTLDFIKPTLPLLLLILLKPLNKHPTNNDSIKLLIIIPISIMCFFCVLYTSVFIIEKQKIEITSEILSLLSYSLSIITITMVVTFIMGVNYQNIVHRSSIIIVTFISIYLYSYSSKYTTQLFIHIGTWVDLVYVIAMLTFIAMCNYFPVLYIIKIFNDNKPSNLFLLNFTPIILILPGLLLPPFRMYMLQRTMINIGISNWCSNYYRVNEKDYSASLFPKKYWHTTIIENNPSQYFILAQAPFYLGSNLLLCPENSRAIYLMKMTMDFKISKNERIMKRIKAAKMFQQCFVFDAKKTEKSNTTFINEIDGDELQNDNDCAPIKLH